MQDSSFLIQQLDTHNIQAFMDFVSHFDPNGDAEYYERCVERHKDKSLVVIMGLLDEDIIGFCLLNTQPKYGYFQKCNLPEIQDLNVLSQYRRHGYGQALVQYCEDLAQRLGYSEMGIGVGLDYTFGAAQRLYARLGYIPDGSGISYDRKQVAVGEFRPIDKNLCLMMSKVLKK